jgi:hypothetical protein
MFPSMDAPKRTNVLAALVAITLLALAVRLPAVQRLLPQAPEPDAFLVLHAQQLDGDPALPPYWEFAERYPTLLTRVLQALPRREPRAGLTGLALEQDALACAAAPYEHGRIVVLLLSILLVPLTWLVARRFVGPPAALIAAWLVATSLLHALFSTQARPHGPQTTFALLATWGALRIVERPSIGRIALGALLASLAIACLQSGMFTLFPLGMALLLANGPWLLRIARAALVPLLAAAGAFWAYPVLPHIDAKGVHLGGAGGHELFFSQFNFHGLSAAAGWFFGHDPFLFVATLLGLVCAIPWLAHHGLDLIRGRHAPLAVALAYVLPYLALVCVTEEIYERFLLPLLPWCAILAAWAWTPFLAWGRDRNLPRILTSFVRGVATLALFVPLVHVIQFARLSARPDTLEEAAAWIRANVPVEDRLLGNPYFSPPILFDPDTLDSMRHDGSAETNVWIAWQMAHPGAREGRKLKLLPARIALKHGDDPAIEAWIREWSPQWVVLEMSRRMDQVPAVTTLRAWADAHGDVVFDSTATAPNVLDRGRADYQSIPDAAHRLMETRAFGSPVRIWKITR